MYRIVKNSDWKQGICGIGIVKEIKEEESFFSRELYKYAIVELNYQNIEIWTKTICIDSRNYRNCGIDYSWVREGMTVYLSFDEDGPYISQDYEGKPAITLFINE